MTDQTRHRLFGFFFFAWSTGVVILLWAGVLSYYFFIAKAITNENNGLFALPLIASGIWTVVAPIFVWKMISGREF